MSRFQIAKGARYLHFINAIKNEYSRFFIWLLAPAAQFPVYR
jgi:hypothetical protein